MYLNTTNGNYYKKTGVSTWTLQGNLTGPPGSGGLAGNTNYIIKFIGSSTGGNSNIYDDGTHIGIGITLPESRLHVKGIADETQLIVAGGTGQTNMNPLIRLRDVSGTELMTINSDHPDNVFVGLDAGLTNQQSNGATLNTFLGSLAGGSNTQGNNLTAVGHNSLFTNSIGVNNTAIGSQALFSNTQGGSNFAGGFLAMYTNTTGSNNVAIGNQTLFLNSNGSSNTAVGAEAASFSMSGGNNTVLGFRALQTATAASFSTAIGSNSLLNTLNGGNTAIGLSLIHISEPTRPY